MIIGDKKLLAFLGPQLRDYGGKVELDTDLWVLFAVEAADEDNNAIARWLLDGTRFANDSGPSEDDRWTLYYVNGADRAAAIDWLADLCKVTAGEVRPVTSAQRALLQELRGSPMPHRIAQKLVELHGRGELSAGVVGDPLLVRTLLDRLHFRDPLFVTALHLLLNDNLVDMIVLLQQLIAEDISLEDELGHGSLSRDPFQKTGQLAAAEIRQLLTRFHVINPLDQRTNTSITNPYAPFMEIDNRGGNVAAPIGGTTVMLPHPSFLDAIRSIRRNLYRGSELSRLDTQAPWMRDEIAYSFRFIKQRLESRKDLSTMDGLYLLERAVAG